MLSFSVSPKTISVKIHEYLEDPRTKYLVEPLVAVDDALRMMEEDKAPVKEVNDYIILSLALRHGLTLATFDIELRKRAAARKVSVIP
ncbi:MAG: hypothetical protein QW463_00455 [Candidatus Caldarchaeum sp.]